MSQNECSMCHTNQYPIHPIQTYREVDEHFISSDDDKEKYPFLCTKCARNFKEIPSYKDFGFEKIPTDIDWYFENGEDVYFHNDALIKPLGQNSFFLHFNHYDEYIMNVVVNSTKQTVVGEGSRKMRGFALMLVEKYQEG